VTATATLPKPVLDELGLLLKENKLELPVLPDVAGQVVRLCGDETCDARMLAGLITRDQGMAGNLMRLVNSPLYAPPSPIVSLQQAIARLGFGKIREIALIISCEAKVFKVPGHEAWVKQQFSHALAAAAFGQEIARSKRWNVEEAFLCGLLHDVGRPVLLQALIDLHASHSCTPDPAAMDAAIDTLHAYVGSQMVTAWTLPARLSETIHHHHHPDLSAATREPATMTAFADDCAHWLLGSEAPGAREVNKESILSHPCLGPLNLYPEDVDALLEKSDSIKQMIAAVVS
jgi:putative nucleotidyltransferase with HDIG domain